MQKFKKYLFACVILSLVLQGCNKNQTASSKPEEEEITVTAIEKAEDEKDEKKEKAAAEKENAESADNAINAESTGNTDGIESAGNAENGKITENTRNAEGAAVETAETTESKTAGDGTAEKEGASANEGEMIGEAVASISGQDASVEGIASEEAGAEYLKKKTESGTADGLRAQVEAALSGKNGTWSVYYKKMSTGESFTIGDQPMVAASLIKLFVYGAVRKKIEAGQLENTYDSTLRSMITVSDNTACNTLIDAVGGFSEVNAFIQSIGCSSSQLNRKMLAAGPENYTSTRDCGFVLESALNGTYVSQETSRLLLEAMGAQTRKGKIPQGVPAGVPTANKTGELGGVENDAAIVYAPSGNYILCVMSSNGNSGEQIAAINQVSSIVYNYENK